eukprot:140502-Lingulodinium_polyedra.AAC.1
MLWPRRGRASPWLPSAAPVAYSSTRAPLPTDSRWRAFSSASASGSASWWSPKCQNASTSKRIYS